MEKEIKVRKKRFAAFWCVVLLAVVLILPAAAEETQTTETTNTTQTAETTQTTETAETTNATQITETTENTETTTATEVSYFSDAKTGTAQKISDLDGKTVAAGTVIGHATEFKVAYFDYDQAKLGDVQTIPYESTHTVSSYTGKASASRFKGWSLAFVEKSGATTYANLTALVDPYPIGAGEHTLTAGEVYILNGVTRVEGDPSTYVSGSTVYGSGTYHFS